MIKLFKSLTISVLLTVFAFSFSFAEGELESSYQQKFSGLNTRLSPKLIGDDETPSCSNITLDETGAIKERDVFGQYNTLSGALGNNAITGLFKYYRTSAKYFVAGAGSKLASGSAGSFTDITNSSLSITPGTYWSAVSFVRTGETEPTLYLFNPSVVMQEWGGTTNTVTPATVPTTNCSYSAVHKARVWAARSDSITYRLYYSSLNDPEDWVTTGGYIDLPGTTQEITGIVSWGGYLYIFTETSIYILLGSTPNDFSMRKTNSQVGAVAPLSIKVTDSGIMFLSRSGVYAFDGNNSHKLTDKIEPTILGISKTLINKACATYDGTKYWLSYTPTGSSYNSRILIYDMTLKEWYFYDNLNINYFERAYGGTDKGEIYGGSSTNNGIVYSLQASTGTESVTHSSQFDFDNDITFNSVVLSTPKVELLTGLDNYTKLLCNFNGADGATSYNSDDDFVRPATFTNSSLDTAQKKFGTASLDCGQGIGYVEFADSNDWFFDTGDFSLECWIRLNSNADIINNSQTFLHCGDYTANGSWTLFLLNGAIPKLEFAYYPSGSATRTTIVQSAWSPSKETWYHVELCRSGNTFYLFVDGTLLTSATSTASMPDSTDGVWVGMQQYNTATVNGMYGWIDGVRISKGIAKHTASFTPYPDEYKRFALGGNLTSQNIQINAYGTSALDDITWVSSEPTNTKVTFQTRTGHTNDTVYYNGWGDWYSANTVNFQLITDSTIITTSDATNFVKKAPATAQARNILYYEKYDDVSPNCVHIVTTALDSKNDYIEETIPIKDLSSVNWLTGWIKSSITGNSIEYSIGETTSTEQAVTINTVEPNTWEKWYWYIGGITPTSRDAIKKVRVTYRGDRAGNIYIGDSEAQNYYTSGDTIDSDPEDYIQFRGIFGSNTESISPYLSSITLAYTPASGTSESSLSSYYYTKFQDYGSPQINKNFLDLFLEAKHDSTTTSTNTVYIDYDIDDGIKTGTLSFPLSRTSNTIRIEKHFPSSAFGKVMRLKMYDNNKDSQVTIRAKEVRYRKMAIDD